MIGMRYDLLDTEAIYQGADWYKDFQIIDPDTSLPYDLTGYTIESQARKKSTDATATIEFDCSVIDSAEGTIRLSLSNTDTSSIAKGAYKYDVEAAEPSPSTIVHKVIIPSIVQVVEEYTK